MYTYRSPFPQYAPRQADTLREALIHLSIIYDATGQVGTIEGVPVRTNSDGNVIVDERNTP